MVKSIVLKSVNVFLFGNKYQKSPGNNSTSTPVSDCTASSSKLGNNSLSTVEKMPGPVFGNNRLGGVDGLSLAFCTQGCRFTSSELRCLPLWRKLDVKINCGDWYPPIWCRTKDIPALGECTRSAMENCLAIGLSTLSLLWMFLLIFAAQNVLL
ncbi:hypothetical protein TNCV_1457071 [Trichonephila clavipes]|nr:hypothetical protein TNCV_1457071 [Trichonephila clavipes]